MNEDVKEQDVQSVREKKAGIRCLRVWMILQPSDQI